MPHERFQGKTQLGFRGDAIVQFDWCVGELVSTLERLDLTKKTLIIFCSDNGPVLDDGYQDGAVTKLGKHQPAGPFRGGKYSIYEGGTRTPFITCWPGVIEPGVSEEMVCTIDLAASMAALIGQPLANGACRDSFNVLGALLGKPDARGRDHLIQQPNRGTTMALRIGDWKVLAYPHAKPAKALTYEKGKGQYDRSRRAYQSGTTRPAAPAAHVDHVGRDQSGGRQQTCFGPSARQQIAACILAFCRILRANLVKSKDGASTPNR